MDPDSCPVVSLTSLPLGHCLPSHTPQADTIPLPWHEEPATACGQSSSQELPIALWPPAPVFLATALGLPWKNFGFPAPQLPEKHALHVFIYFAVKGVCTAGSGSCAVVRAVPREPSVSFCQLQTQQGHGDSVSHWPRKPTCLCCVPQPAL